MERLKNIPSLRFPEFIGKWELMKVGDVVQFINGKAHENDIDEGGKYIVVNSKFISQDGKVKKYSNKNILPLFRNNIVMVMSDVPNGKALAKCFLIDQDEKYTLNQRICALLENKCHNPFLIRVINRNEYYLSFDSGVGQTNLKKEDVLNCPIHIPLNISEQTKIATFLTAVDERLNQLKQKKTILEQYKKGVMQKIFDQVIRFKDDDGNEYPDWGIKKMVEIGEFKNGINKGKEDFGFGSPFINLMDVFGKSTISNLKLDLVNANEKELKLYELKKGDVLFIRSSVKKSGVGETSLIMNDLTDTVFSGFLIRFRDTKIKLDLGFKKFCFAVRKFRENLISLSTTSANTNINQESLNELEISLPSLAEQTKMANFLSAIDEKISLCNNQIAKTEQYKKGLLQQMFV